MSAPTTHLNRQAIDHLCMVKKKEGIWQASAVLKVAEITKEGTGAHLHGGVLELTKLTDVKFPTELFPENEGETEAEVEFVYGLAKDNKDNGLDEMAKAVEKFSCEELPFRDRFDGVPDSLSVDVDGISFLSS